MGRNYNYAKYMIIRTVQPQLMQHTNRWRRRRWRTLRGSMAARMGATIVVGSDCWWEVASATQHWTIFFLFSDLNLFPLFSFSFLSELLGHYSDGLGLCTAYLGCLILVVPDDERWQQWQYDKAGLMFFCLFICFHLWLSSMLTGGSISIELLLL